MSYLTYNGIVMQVESFQRFDQVAVYSDDGADYLYTEVTIVVRAFWHPKTINDMASLGVTVTAATAMDTIRRSLLSPRQSLIVSAPVAGNNGSTPFLRSPLLKPSGLTAYSTDAKNGPQPQFANIQQIVGEEAMIVDFGIVTWVNECPGAAGNPVSPVLSHRWSMAHTIGDDQHTRRIIAGTAVFRTDMLYDVFGNILFRADDFRDFLFTNIPPNFRRVNVHVDAVSDGTRMEYVVEDKEVDAIIDPKIHGLAEVADIDGTYSELIEAAPGISFSGAANGASQGAVAGAAIGAAGGPIGAAGGAVIGGVAGAGLSGLLPGRSYEVQIRVRGTRRSTRAGLVQVAVRAALGFGIGIRGIDPTPSLAFIIRAIVSNFLTESSLQVGLVDKWVNLRLTYRASGVTSLVHQTVGAIQGAGLFSGLGGLSGGTAGMDRVRAAISAAAQGAPGPATAAFTAASDVPNSGVPISPFDPTFPDNLPGVTKSYGSESDSFGPRGGTLAYGYEKGSRGATIAHLVTAAFKTPCSLNTPPPRATNIWNANTNAYNQARK